MNTDTPLKLMTASPLLKGESLLGHLQHAAKVVRPGRQFIRGMLSLLRVARKQHHYIRLNASFTADLRWRHTFAMEWNGISMLYQLKRHSPDEEYFKTPLDLGVVRLCGRGNGSNSSGYLCHLSRPRQKPQRSCSQLSCRLVHGVTFGQEKLSFYLSHQPFS